MDRAFYIGRGPDIRRMGMKRKIRSNYKGVQFSDEGYVALVTSFIAAGRLSRSGSTLTSRSIRTLNPLQAMVYNSLRRPLKTLINDALTEHGATGLPPFR